jgi:hypothetical protein
MIYTNSDGGAKRNLPLNMEISNSHLLGDII